MSYTLHELQDALKISRDGFDKFRAFFADRQKWDRAKTHPFYKTYIDEILLSAEKYKNENIPVLKFSDYKLYDTKDSRIEYELSYFIKRGILNTYAALSLLYDDKEYLEKLEDIIWAICDEYTWCLPAHLSGKSLEIIGSASEVTDGILYAPQRSHRETVDLFAAETSFALAEVTAMLKERLSPIVTHRACKEINERVITPFMNLNASFSWETNTTNWAAVCAGSVGAAAMYLIEDTHMLAPIISKTLSTMEYFLEGYKDDGVCAEGLAYWNYGFGYFVYFAELLLRRTSGKINLFNNEKVAQIASFQEKCYLSEDMVVCFSDSLPTFKYTLGLTHYLKSIFNISVPPEKYSSGFYTDDCNRFPHAMRLFTFTDPMLDCSLLDNRSHWFSDTQWLIVKGQHNDKPFAFAAKGGHNNEPHNHNDIGSFMLHYNSVNLLTDVGCGEYNKSYFQPASRYGFFCNSSLGHNIPIINGQEQKAGAQFSATNVEYSKDKRGDELTMEIQNAYDVQSLTKLTRSFLIKEGTVNLTVKDAFTFSNVPENVSERFISLHEPCVKPDGVVDIVTEKASLSIHYDNTMLNCEIKKTSFVDHYSEDTTVYIIDFKYTGSAECFTLQFDFELL